MLELDNPFLKRNYGSCGERDLEVRCRCPENMLVDPSAYDHRYLLNGSRLDTNLYQRFKVIQPFYYLHKSSYGKPMLVPKGAEFIKGKHGYFYWTDNPRVTCRKLTRSGMFSFDVMYNGSRQNGLYLLKHNWGAWPRQKRRVRINIQHVYHPGTSPVWNPALPAGHGLPGVSNGNENSGIYFNFTYIIRPVVKRDRVE